MAQLPRKSVISVSAAGALGGASAAIFWLIAARRFSLETIGLSAGVASMAAVVNVLTSLGFAVALVRHSHDEHSRGGLLIWAASSSAVASVVGSALAVGVAHFIPGPFRHLPPLELFWALTVVSASAAITQITDVVGAPMGNSWLGPARGVFLIGSRIAIALWLSPSSGPIALNIGFAVPAAVTAVVAVGILGVQLGFADGFTGYFPGRKQLGAFWRFALGAWPSSLIMNLLAVAPPLLAIWILGARDGAVFYVCWNAFVLGNLLVAASTSLGVSPTVDGAHLHNLVRRLSAACSILMALGGPVLLLFYGPKYFHLGWIAIAILGVSLYPYSLEQLELAVLRRRIRHARATRLVAILGVFGFGGLALGGTLGDVWGMALGWLIGVLVAYVVESFLSSRSGSHLLGKSTTSTSSMIGTT